jgi:hypothetical protein
MGEGVRTPPPCLKWLNGLPSRTSRVGLARQPATSLNVSRRRLSTTEGRSLIRSCASPSLPSPASWAGEDHKSRQELTRVEARARERHLPRTTPLPMLLLLRTWRINVREADGKAKRKRGKHKRGRGGQGAKSGPDQQQAAPVAVQGRPSGAPRGNGQTQCPRNNNKPNLSLPREQRRAKVDNRRAAPNGTRPIRWDQPPVQAPMRSPPRRDTRRSPERTLDNSRRRQRTPSSVDCRARPDDAKLLGFVATTLEIIKERVLHQ